MEGCYVVQRRTRKWFGRWETLWVDAADSPLYLPHIDTTSGMYNAGRPPGAP